MMLDDRFQLINSQIKSAATRAGREKDKIQFLAVSKKQPSTAIEAAYQIGIRDFAENYVQELVEKQKQLSHLKDIRWHLIGHLQKNKLKYLENLSAIHSVDSLELAVKICQNKNLAGSQLYIQLIVDEDDKNKTGCSLLEAKKIADFLTSQKSLKWVGFMGIGPADANPSHLKDLYKRFIKNSQDIWNEKNKDSAKKCPEYSLGMSSDLELAIEVGSTCVRIGTALFGARQL